jgi:hypothetical protein
MRCHTVASAESASSSSAVDFIAIDSNHRPLGDYYPRAFVYTGTGTYHIELAQGADFVNSGSQNVTMGPTDVVVVRDVFLTAGTTTTFKVIPGSSRSPRR